MHNLLTELGYHVWYAITIFIVLDNLYALRMARGFKRLRRIQSILWASLAFVVGVFVKIYFTAGGIW